MIKVQIEYDDYMWSQEDRMLPFAEWLKSRMYSGFVCGFTRPSTSRWLTTRESLDIQTQRHFGELEGSPLNSVIARANDGSRPNTVQ